MAPHYAHEYLNLILWEDREACCECPWEPLNITFSAARLVLTDRCTSLGRLEVHLVGGFSDDRQLSQKLTHQLLSKFIPPLQLQICVKDALLKQELMNSWGVHTLSCIETELLFWQGWSL